MEWDISSVYKTLNSIFLRFWSVIGVSTRLELSHPECTIFRFFHIEEASIDHLIQFDFSPIRFDISGGWLESFEDFSECYFLSF
jgi:hypothetical protein